MSNPTQRFKALLEKVSGHVIGGLVTAFVLYIVVLTTDWISGGGPIKLLGGATAGEVKDLKETDLDNAEEVTRLQQRIKALERKLETHLNGGEAT